MFRLDLYLEDIHSSLFQLFGGMQQKRLKSIQSKKKGKGGRKPKLSKRDERSIIRALHYARKQDGNFTSNFILVFPGYMTELYAVLNKYGYHYRQARRKGLLTESDLKLRMKFAKVL